MAYDERQRRIIAHALAVCGLSPAAASRFLKEHSIECPDVGETTIRRFLADPEFTEMVAQQAKLAREEQDQATRQAERSRFQREIEGSFGDRVARLEKVAWECFEKIAAEVEKPDVDKREILAFWNRAMEFVTKLKAQKTPAIAEMWQAEALIAAYQKVLMKVIGPALTQQVQLAVGKEFQTALLARESQAAEAADAAPPQA